MLILPHADGLGIDLDQLRQRILQTAADRDRSAHGKIEIGELLAGDLGGGIDRRARFAHRHDDRSRDFRMLLVQALECLPDEGLRLAPRRAVADGDRLNLVFRDDHRHRLGGLLRLLLRENDGLAEILAGAVHHRHLAAGADAGVDGQHRLFAQRRSKQQVAEILAENLDGRAVGLHLLFHRHVDLAARGEQPLVGVLRRLGDLPVGGGVADGTKTGQHRQHPLRDRLAVKFELHPQHSLLLPAADRQIPVRGNGRDRLFEIVVLLEFGRLFGSGGSDLATDLGMAGELVAHKRAHIGDVGDALGDDVARVLQLLRAFRTVPSAVPDGVRQRLEPLLLRHLRAGAALGLVGLVQIFERAFLPAGRDFRRQFLG